MPLSLLLLVLTLASTPRERAVDETVAREMAQRHIPGLSLAVVVDGELVLARGYGMANLELSVAATESTAYLIASITKTFTAVATMMLVEEGSVTLEDPIASHLTGLPEAWAAVTVRQLLDHTSGISSVTAHDAPPCAASEPGAEPTQANILEEVACLPLDFVPGTEWSYNDTGYFLLGMLIEQVSAKSYGEFLRERVFRPAGMADSRLLSNTDLIPNRASGYVWVDDHYENGPVMSPVGEFSFGGLVSTVLDLVRYDAALAGGRLLQPETLDAMWTGSAASGGNYGLGFALRPVEGRRHVGHTGGGPAAATAYARFPDDGVTVLLLTNVGQPPFATRALAGEVARLFFED